MITLCAGACMQVNLSSTVTTSSSGHTGLTAWTGAGITNSLLVAQLFAKGPKGVASLSGSCPSVGTGGAWVPGLGPG